MRKKRLGKSELRVSAVGFGGIPITRLTDEQASSVIRRALDLEVNFIDTAEVYGDSQKKIGNAVGGRRDDLVLASKSPASDADTILRHIEKALREMQTDRLDLYQLHNVADPEKWEKIRGSGGALEGLVAARDRGLIRHIGFSSHSLDMSLQVLDCEEFETIQFPFNLVTREPGEELIPEVLKRDLGFIVMKPMCGGQFDDAELAFKFLNGFPELVPIPGIERVSEIEEIVELVKSDARLDAAGDARVAEIVERLGPTFCRRCGYCQPCPQGVPVQATMIFESMVKRMVEDQIAQGIGRRVIEGAANCTECGECEQKCPYNLEIIKTIKKNGLLAENLLKELPERDAK